MNLYEPTKKFLLSSVLAAAVSLGGISLIAWILFSKISMINEEVQKTKQMNVSVERAYKIKGQLNEAEEKLTTLDSFFIGKDEEVKFIEKLESLASSTNVKLEIQSISLDSKAKQNFKDDLSIHLQAEGGRAGLISFLRSLERLPKAVSIDKADLSSNDQSWTLRLELVAYKLK